MKTFPIRINDDLHRRIKHAAIDAGVSLHDWIVRALQDSADREGKAEHGNGRQARVRAAAKKA